MTTPTAIQTRRLQRNSRRLTKPSEAQVEAMAESIRSIGMIVQPIEVRRAGDGFEIVDGEVRWLAAQKLNIEIVPIRVVPVDAHDCAAASLILNMDREAIAPAEIVSNLESLFSTFGLDASETIEQNLPELLMASEGSPELRARVDALLAKCGIERQP